MRVNNYGDEELFHARFNVKRDGFETILATVLVVGSQMLVVS